MSKELGILDTIVMGVYCSSSVHTSKYVGIWSFTGSRIGAAL